MARWRQGVLGALCLSLTAATTAPLATSVELHPAGTWVLTKGSETCSVSRPFVGPSGQTSAVRIRSAGPFGSYEFQIAGPDVLRDKGKPHKIDVLPEYGSPTESVVGIASLANGQPTLTFLLQGERPGSIFIRGRWDNPVRFAAPADFQDQQLTV